MSDEASGELHTVIVFGEHREWMTEEVYARHGELPPLVLNKRRMGRLFLRDKMTAPERKSMQGMRARADICYRETTPRALVEKLTGAASCMGEELGLLEDPTLLLVTYHAAVCAGQEAASLDEAAATLLRHHLGVPSAKHLHKHLRRLAAFHGGLAGLHVELDAIEDEGGP